MEFSGYIIASPAIHRDPSVLGRLAASAMRPHGQRVFLAVGGAEEPIMLQDYAQLAAAIAASGSKLTVVNRTYEGASHLSYYPRLVVDAFPWLLPALK
jgi:predicted alpha/beta superfamily hydrolase